MRLRYLHLPDLPPLRDVEIVFGHEAILGHNLAIHFIAGVNGTGKTRLLQAITATFLSLARDTLPPFAVTLAYDLGEDPHHRTILFHKPFNEEETPRPAFLVEFDECLTITERAKWADLIEVDWKSSAGSLPYAINEEPLMGEELLSNRCKSLLPQTILAYTSGSALLWQELFAQQNSGKYLTDTPVESEEDNVGYEERPAQWSIWKEREYQLRIGGVLPEETTGRHGDSPDKSAGTQALILMTSQQLRLAACALTLQRAIERQTTQDESSLDKLLSEVKWGGPLVLTLYINFDPERLPYAGLPSQLHDLYQIATSVVREPEPSTNRTLVFDLYRPLAEDLPIRTIPDWTSCLTLQAFCEILDRESLTAFGIFHTLHKWQEIGLLEDLTITLRREGVEHALLYDWLSDGERMFLGRIALFYLLQGRPDALLILDEPETHFNDFWKRHVVDIIDDSLREQNTEVLISTHSSIALTDVFHTEITLLDNGQAYLPRIRTFGASPSEIMRDVFDTPNSVGQRAAEFLDLLLLMFIYPEEVEGIWTLGEDQEAIVTSLEFQRLSEQIRQEAERWAINYDSVEKFEEELLKKLLDVYTYTQPQVGKTLDVATVLQILQDQLIGPGYYQFEIIRRILGLQEGYDAPSD